MVGSGQVKSNPNALVGFGSATGGGILTIWIFSLFGISIDNMVACAIAGGIAGFFLAIGKITTSLWLAILKNGIIGCWRIFLRGESAQKIEGT